MRRIKMSDHVRDYLACQRKVGFKLRSQGVLLEEFARYADNKKVKGPLTVGLMVEWATQTKKNNPKYHSVRLQAVTKFAKFRSIYDPKTEIPPRGIFGRTQSRSNAVIYSEEQMQKLIKKIRVHKTKNNFTRETYETLIGLLLCTGLRISEALGLSDDGVDLESGIIRVVETKFSKSRLVPLHPSTVLALKIYKIKRDKKFSGRFDNAFFVGDKGRRMTYGGLQSKFWIFKQKTGLQQDLLATNPFHCFRHTFAVRRLTKWHREGLDTEARIAALSTYMGHVKVSDTYWYFSACPELMEIVSKRFEQLSMYNTGTFQ